MKTGSRSSWASGIPVARETEQWSPRMLLKKKGAQSSVVSKILGEKPSIHSLSLSPPSLSV